MAQKGEIAPPTTIFFVSPNRVFTYATIQGPFRGRKKTPADPRLSLPIVFGACGAVSWVLCVPYQARICNHHIHAWTRVTGAGPAGRAAHSLQYLPRSFATALRGYEQRAPQ